MTLNYIYKSRDEAINAPKAKLVLCQCQTCGLVFAAPADTQAIYDERYENRQSYSNVFKGHLNHIADQLKTKLPQSDINVLEIGCGKGHFLELLAKRNHWQGQGYDTSYEGPNESADGKLKFSKSYLTSKSVKGKFDLLVCRHVIEHIDSIGEFIIELAEIARQTETKLVMLETPRLEWIFENQTIWDFFHEHRCYFGMSVLRQLCQAAGFEVVEHDATFGEQYQNLYLRTLEKPVDITWSYDPSLSLKNFIAEALEQFTSRVKGLESILQRDTWRIWGAGAKGVCWAGWLDHLKYPLWGKVIDMNPAKQGGFLPVTGLPIVAPTKQNLKNTELIFVINPNYLHEIQKQLISLDLSPKIMTL